MVVQNIDTDLDLTNGACGTIVDIVYAKLLHPDEPPIKGDQTVVNLKFLPLYILVKLDRTWIASLEGLDKNVVPIQAPAKLCEYGFSKERVNQLNNDLLNRL